MILSEPYQRMVKFAKEQAMTPDEVLAFALRVVVEMLSADLIDRLLDEAKNNHITLEELMALFIEHNLAKQTA